MGRYALTANLGLEKAGVAVEKNGKIMCHKNDEATNVENIFAIGDVIHGQLELTPVAIKAGMLLVNRLFAGKTALMDYTNVPTCVFTPIEYGACGYSEEDSIKEFGRENISVFHTKYKPLEWMYSKEVKGSYSRTAYVKVICNKADSLRVVGFHLCAPNAGEVTQGVAMGIKCGMTKE
jgi:thioredoxin reductase (NADPH)